MPLILSPKLSEGDWEQNYMKEQKRHIKMAINEKQP
jgi:hypothetical protein